MRRKALTIAGSDSGGGAGIQADLKTFVALGVYGTSVVTAVTAQNTVGVFGVHEIPTSLIARQIDAVMDDIGTDAAKTGMLSSAEIIATVADRVKYHGIEKLVVDPVMVAKSGDRLLESDAVDALKQLLLPLALVITPNLPEAETIVGHPIADDLDTRRAAEEIHRLGAKNVVMKGGHRSTPDAADVLFDGATFHTFRSKRIETPHTHGTGCTLSAAIAAGLARGQSVPDAVAAAKVYLTGAIRAAYPIGAGHSPVHHFFLTWDADGEDDESK